ncbi:MAG: lipid-A-disaccharide synthase [Flavobacteriaceae bacterium]
MKYYLIAGEASGDLHGSNLIKALAQKDENASFRAMGGDLMQKSGAVLDFHYKHMGFMGFFELLRHLFKIKKRIAQCKADIEAFQPDALILIDFSGFNLRIAKWAKEAGFLVHYYIAPQVWASRPKRVELIKTSVDHLYVTLPFEPEFYAKHHYKVEFVGHPLLDALEDELQNPEAFKDKYDLDERPIVALLPGSRTQEIKRILPVMEAVATELTAYQFVIAGAPSQEKALYDSITDDQLQVVFGATQDLLKVAHIAVVTSGTATLETALIGTPQVVCYKTSPLTFAIAKRLITLRYISLVNLILDRPCLTELIQNDCTPSQLKKALEYLENQEVRAKMFEQYAALKTLLGEKGASARAATAIYENTLSAHLQATRLSQ